MRPAMMIRLWGQALPVESIMARPFGLHEPHSARAAFLGEQRHHGRVGRLAATEGQRSRFEEFREYRVKS